MIQRLKNRLSDAIVNLKGFKTNRKIVVIESDDWGSVRMPSKEAYHNLQQNGIKVNECAYNTYDTLASDEDLLTLFEVLKKHKDINNKPAVFTANAIMANPDFDKIKSSGFNEYFFEPFTDTLKKQFPEKDIFSIWIKGKDECLFYPQFHGREHLNVYRWMNALKSGLPETRLAFDNKVYGISTTITSEKRKSYLPAFDFDTEKELSIHEKILMEGLQVFYEKFGYRSRSFIAPNYTWSPLLEKALKENGIDTIQGARAQRVPTGNRTKIKKHYTGDVNKQGQVFLARNVTFEPSINSEKDWYTSVLLQVSNAFYWNTPVIIATHRLNYIGGLVKENRDKNLELLDKLLKEMLRKWPDIEFMTSDKLGTLILTSKN